MNKVVKLKVLRVGLAESCSYSLIIEHLDYKIGTHLAGPEPDGGPLVTYWHLDAKTLKEQVKDHTDDGRVYFMLGLLNPSGYALFITDRDYKPKHRLVGDWRWEYKPVAKWNVSADKLLKNIFLFKGVSQ